MKDKPWHKDINFMKKGKPCKDVGLNTSHTKKATSGCEAVAGSPVEPRPYKNG